MLPYGELLKKGSLMKWSSCLMRSGGSRYAGKLAIAAAVTAAAAATPAHAADPFNAGVGHDPQVAVGSDGVGHVVWHTDETGDRVGYCRVPKNGTACDGASKFLAFPGGAAAFSLGATAQVFAPAPNKVVVIGGCYICGAGGATDRVYRWISTNNGGSFGAPTEIANNLQPGGQGAYVVAGDVFVGIEGRELLAGPTALATTPIMPLPSGYVYSSSVVRVPGLNRLLAASSNLSAARYTTFNGTLTAASINNLLNWSVPQAPPGGPLDDDETALGAGAGGTFLVFTRYIPNDNQVIVHRYDPATGTFGTPVAIEGPDPIDNASSDYTDVAVDNAGPHVIWRSLYDDGRLRYRRSTDGGATWGAVLNVTTHDTYIDPEIAVAPDGSGFATWTGIGTSAVRVVALDPQPEPQPPPAAPPAPTPPPTTSPVYDGPFRSVTVSDENARYAVSVPRNCLAPGQRFRVTLKWRRKKRRGNPFVKVRRVDFYRNRKRVKIDKKRPFRHTYKVSASQPPGSTIRIRARAFLKVKRGKAPRKWIRARVRVCP